MKKILILSVTITISACSSTITQSKRGPSSVEEWNSNSETLNFTCVSRTGVLLKSTEKLSYKYIKAAELVYPHNDGHKTIKVYPIETSKKAPPIFEKIARLGNGFRIEKEQSFDLYEYKELDEENPETREFHELGKKIGSINDMTCTTFPGVGQYSD